MAQGGIDDGIVVLAAQAEGVAWRVALKVAGDQQQRGTRWFAARIDPIEESGCQESVFLSVNSAGKALGVSGAFVCGPDWAVDYLIQAARPFVFSTAPPPAVAEAIDEALNLLKESPETRERVRELGSSLRQRLGLPPGDSPIVPIVLGTNESATSAARRLRESGFDVRAIRPPTVPEGTARLRVSLNAKLRSGDILEFAGRLKSILGDMGQ